MSVFCMRLFSGSISSFNLNSTIASTSTGSFSLRWPSWDGPDSRLFAIPPVSGPSFGVCDGHDDYLLTPNLIDKGVGKSPKQDPSIVFPVSGPALGRIGNQSHGPLRFPLESQSHPDASLCVPSVRSGIFLSRVRVKSDVNPFHRLASRPFFSLPPSR